MVTFSRLGQIALDLIYPPRCAICSRGGSMLCSACEASLPRPLPPRCPRCWLPRFESTRCRHCDEKPLSLNAVRAAYRYEKEARRLVHALKYRDQSALAPIMAGSMGLIARDEGLAADVILPVPLTAARQRQRGYNQASLLAKEVARALNTPILPRALRRTRSSPPQAQTASAEQRRRNVEGAFRVSRTELVAGKRVLLVDDVITTGATLDACSRVLLAAGVREVAAITYARED